LQGGLGWLQSK